jgi:hypothetical protein
LHKKKRRDEASSLRFFLSILSLPAFACGDPPPVQAPTSHDASDAGDAPASSIEYAESTWGKFHSERFHLSLPLPDGKQWRIDDHSAPELVAEHAGTQSKVTLVTWFENELVNHKACEEGAREIGYLPKSDLRTVDEFVTVGPEAFDTRVWVAVDTQKKDGPLVGHLFLFGAYVRKCLFLHLETRVKTREEEAKLSSRLATARVTMIRELKLDPPRITDEAAVPRQKPDFKK